MEVNELFKNGTFRTLREIFYVVSMIIAITLAYANMTNVDARTAEAVERNTEAISAANKRIDAIEEMSTKCDKNLENINTNLEWIKKNL